MNFQLIQWQVTFQKNFWLMCFQILQLSFWKNYYQLFHSQLEHTHSKIPLITTRTHIRNSSYGKNGLANNSYSCLHIINIFHPSYFVLEAAFSPYNISAVLHAWKMCRAQYVERQIYLWSEGGFNQVMITFFDERFLNSDDFFFWFLRKNFLELEFWWIYCGRNVLMRSICPSADFICLHFSLLIKILKNWSWTIYRLKV